MLKLAKLTRLALMYKYIFGFLAYIALIIFYFNTQYNEKYDNYKEYLENSINNSLSAAINSFDLINDAYYSQNESILAKIVKDANGASKKTRDRVRYRLREKFTNMYNSRKLSSLDVFHIFDKDGNSLIRFHKLNYFDDHTIEVRDSLKNMIDKKIAKKGIEVGRLQESFRFQYPLFYNGKFVGSFEFGINFKAIDKQIQKLFGIKNILLIDENIINGILLKNKINERYNKIKIGKKIFYTPNTDMNKEVSSRFEYVIRKPEMSKNLSLSSVGFTPFKFKNINYIAISTPLIDINKKQIGYILTGVKDTISADILKNYIQDSIISILLGLMVIIFIYRQHSYRKYIRNIIDSQRDILIVTDGTIMYDANRRFLTFFGYKNLKEFKKDRDCICDYFIEEDGYIQKYMNGVSWFEHVAQNMESENVVVMYDEYNKKRYFKILLEGFSHSRSFIVVFNDITNNLIKQHELENKAYYDDLTRIYSRERFNYYLDSKLNQGREFSLIMFDIDFFKAINDNFGHDIGDYVLKELTKHVSKHLREGDIFARWGGEEFMIIIDSDIVGAEKLANKIRNKIEQHDFKHIDQLTCSFGVSKYKDKDKAKDIIKRVDTMLYSAKESGRNCVVALS